MGDEQRTYLRIPTKLHGRMRLLDSEKEQFLFREAPIVSTTVTAMELKGAGVNEALVNALMSIDQKLDMLIGIHTQGSLQDDFPLAVEVSEISGAGVKMTSSAPLAEGQNLELVFTLTQLPVRMAGAMGPVVRQETQDGNLVWAVDFFKIRDRDLESIVQFVFQTQRDELRVRKWEYSA